MPTENDPTVPSPAPIESKTPGTGAPGTSPTPDGNDKPPQTKSAVTAAVQGAVIGGVVSAAIGAAPSAD